jgi:hypothetical protein
MPPHFALDLEELEVEAVAESRTDMAVWRAECGKRLAQAIASERSEVIFSSLPPPTNAVNGSNF